MLFVSFQIIGQFSSGEAVCTGTQTCLHSGSWNPTLCRCDCFPTYTGKFKTLIFIYNILKFHNSNNHLKELGVKRLTVLLNHLFAIQAFFLINAEQFLFKTTAQECAIDVVAHALTASISV